MSGQYCKVEMGIVNMSDEVIFVNGNMMVLILQKYKER